MNLTQNKIYILFIALSLCLLILFSTNALAVPDLGVATGGPYAVAPEDSWDDLDYQEYFVGSDFVSGSEDNHGFVLPSDGAVTIFTNILGSDIYLLTDATAGGGSSPSFGKDLLSQEPMTLLTGTGQADGYKPVPYYVINLGPVCSAFDGAGNCTGVNTGWSLVPLPSPPFNPAPFHAFEGIITYLDPLPGGTYFFVAADEDNNNMLYFNTGAAQADDCYDPSCTDPFSPKTDSAFVPEPATLLLLGTGLIALVGFKMRKIKRKR